MAHVKVWLHMVWGTKNRRPLLTKEIRKKVTEHIKENARTKGLYIYSINGYLDHLHCLVALNADMSIAKTAQLMKGESAHWINKQGMIAGKFEWADGYFAASVSESGIESVREYIEMQEEHHAKLSFMQEYEKFMKEYFPEGQG